VRLRLPRSGKIFELFHIFLVTLHFVIVISNGFIVISNGYHSVAWLRHRVNFGVGTYVGG
jgi:hypothetical protein